MHLSQLQLSSDGAVVIVQGSKDETRLCELAVRDILQVGEHRPCLLCFACA